MGARPDRHRNLQRFTGALDAGIWRRSACALRDYRCYRSPVKHLFLAARENVEPRRAIHSVWVTVESCGGEAGC